MEKLSDYPNAKLHDVRLPYPFTRYALVIPDKYNQMIVDLNTGKLNPAYGKRGDEIKKKVGAFKDGQLVFEFESLMEAQRNGFTASLVCDCLKGRRNTHKSLEWKYLK